LIEYIVFDNLRDQIQNTVEFIRNTGYSDTPDAALIFGTGLGEIAKDLEIDNSLSYDDIPVFVKATVESHAGRMLFGHIGSHKVVAMDGRFHYYEGYSMKDITFPVRVMNGLGAKTLMLSNISGGINPEFRAGDVVVITDHINLMWDNPLIGPNDDKLGPRYPDMIEPFSHRLITLAEKHARKMNIDLKRAVYAALTGPTYETRAEMRMIRKMGGDLAGMSSVPETLTALHGGMEVMGLSLVSNECFPDCLKPIDPDGLMERAAIGAGKMFRIFKAVLEDREL